MKPPLKRLSEVLTEQREECLHLITLHRWVRRGALALGPVYGLGLGIAIFNGNGGGLVLYLVMALVMGWALVDSTRKIENYTAEVWVIDATLNTLRERKARLEAERKDDIR